jgi:isoquinoline 1-oxidoreductase beta subunit
MSEARRPASRRTTGERHPADPSRRRFLVSSASAASGLVIGFAVSPALFQRILAAEEEAPAGAAKPALPRPDAFLRIAPDGTITVQLSHSEMGQGIWTTLPMLLAEELDCELGAIRVEHAPAAPDYFHTAFGMQVTGGSTTTWSEFDRYRTVGAMARDMLVRAAAARWEVAHGECRTEGGFVVNGRRKLSYGALSEAAAALPPPTEVTLRPAESWKIIGKPTKRLDSFEKVTGRAEFGLDVRLPGLLVAVVERAPVFGGTVKSFSAAKALKVPGVRKVYQVPSGIAVVGDHFWAAQKGREAVEVVWNEGAGATVDTEKLRETFRSLATKGGGARANAAGDITVALESAAGRLEAEYDGPYLAHAPMEPLNCTVRLSKDKCEIWTGTQMQTGDQMAAARVAGLEPSQVQVHTTFLGGGFGRRANPSADFVSEAVHVAKGTGGPVKVVWTREDDIRGGYFRPQWLHRAVVGFGQDGMPVAWHHAIVCQSILAGTAFAAMVQNGVDQSSVEGCADSPYLEAIPNRLVELHSPSLPVTVLWWRSVGHTHTAFVMESLIDELAHRAGSDPLEYRRKLLAGHPRHLGVLNLAASKAGWGRPLPKGRARGLAVHESFGSFVAQVAEVSVEGGRIRVHRVTAAVDCGICVNPEAVRAQLEGAVGFGLSAVHYGNISMVKGRVQQSNFHDYEMLRIEEMPAVDAHVVASTERPGGVGEPGVPPVAPAVANAVYAATGKRLRRLPLELPRG